MAHFQCALANQTQPRPPAQVLFPAWPLTATRIMSASQENALSPSRRSRSPTLDIEDTDWLIANRTPFRFSSIPTFFPRSGSMVVMTLGAISTMVTSNCRYLSASAISSSMYPLPTMTTCFWPMARKKKSSNANVSLNPAQRETRPASRGPELAGGSNRLWWRREACRMHGLDRLAGVVPGQHPLFARVNVLRLMIQQ